MQKRLIPIFAFFLVTALSFPAATQADGFTLTIMTTDLTVVGGNTLTATFILANNTTSDATIDNFVGGAAFFSGPDPTDSFANSVIASLVSDRHLSKSRGVCFPAGPNALLVSTKEFRGFTSS